MYCVPVKSLDWITGDAYFFSPQLQLFLIDRYGLNNKNCGGDLSMMLLLKLFKIKKIIQDVQGIKPGNKTNSKFRLSFHHYPKEKFATIC